MPAVKVTQAKISRVVKAFLACDLPVGGVEVDADGTIRVLAVAAIDQKPESANDKAMPKQW